MTLQPKSPRVGRSPKLKAKWLSNTLAYQYGNNGTKKSEIIVLANDLDQYLQVTEHLSETDTPSGQATKLLCLALQKGSRFFSLREDTFIKRDLGCWRVKKV